MTWKSLRLGEISKGASVDRQEVNALRLKHSVQRTGASQRGWGGAVSEARGERGLSTALKAK